MTREIDRCSFCGADIPDIHDSPMLRDEVWESIGGHDGDFDEDENWIPCYMCIDCMEKRLKREVRESDLMRDADGSHVYWNRKFLWEHLGILAPIL